MEKIFYYFGLISFGFCCQIIFCFLLKKYKEENKKKAPVIPDFATTLRKLTENLNLLEIKLKEYKKHIPDYKKGSVNKPEMIADSRKYQEHIFDNPKAKEEARNHLVDSFKMAFEKGQIKFPYKKETDSNINELKNFFYESGFRSGKAHFYEEWSKKLNEHLRSKGFKNYEPFGMAPIEDKEPKIDLSTVYHVIKNETKTPTAPPLGFNHDFHKGMLEAQKEVDRVCKPKSFEINNFESPCPKCAHRYISLSVDLRQKTNKCKNCYSCFSVEIINNKIIITEIN